MALYFPATRWDIQEFKQRWQRGVQGPRPGALQCWKIPVMSSSQERWLRSSGSSKIETRKRSQRPSEWGFESSEWSVVSGDAQVKSDEGWALTPDMNLAFTWKTVGIFSKIPIALPEQHLSWKSDYWILVPAWHLNLGPEFLIWLWVPSSVKGR